MQDMTTRSGHYTALLETMGAPGATKLHADEREQLLAVADALLFGDPDSEQGLATGAGSDRAPAGERALVGGELRRATRAPLRLRTAPRGRVNEPAARVRAVRDQASRAARGGSSTRAQRGERVLSHRWSSEPFGTSRARGAPSLSRREGGIQFICSSSHRTPHQRA
jgi:hypothetical protein